MKSSHISHQVLWLLYVSPIPMLNLLEFVLISNKSWHAILKILKSSISPPKFCLLIAGMLMFSSMCYFCRLVIASKVIYTYFFSGGGSIDSQCHSLVILLLLPTTTVDNLGRSDEGARDLSHRFPWRHLFENGLPQVVQILPQWAYVLEKSNGI
jgi:hypothetical protein